MLSGSHEVLFNIHVPMTHKTSRLGAGRGPATTPFPSIACEDAMRRFPEQWRAAQGSIERAPIAAPTEAQISPLHRITPQYQNG